MVVGSGMREEWDGCGTAEQGHSHDIGQSGHTVTGGHSHVLMYLCSMSCVQILWLRLGFKGLHVCTMTVVLHYSSILAIL